MKKKLLVFLLTIVLSISYVNAASFTISTGTQSLIKGNSTKLTIKGSDVTGRFNISSSNPGVISVSEDRAWIENSSYTITLNALSVGTSTITVTPSGVSDSNGNQVSLGAKSIKITVSLPREKSTDNNLKSLEVEGYELSPAFDKDVLEYKVTVNEGTKSVNIKANPSSNYAKVTGKGTINVVDGINNLEVIVTSESGSKKIYKVIVEVIDATPIVVEVNGKSFNVVKLREQFACPESFIESEVSINDTTIPACTNENINYTLIGLKDEEGNIKPYVYDDSKKEYSSYSFAHSTDLKIIILDLKELENANKTKVVIDDITYDSYTYNDGERYYIVYGKNIETGEEDFYLYDSKNKTFSSYDQKFISSLLNKKEDSKDIYKYVALVFGVGLFLSIICIIMLNNKNKHVVKNNSAKKNNEVEEKEKIVEEEENILDDKPKKRKRK